MIEVGFIVEGHGDTRAVPIVFRRIAALEFPNLDIITGETFRVSRDKLKRPAELERTVEFVARRIRRPGAILIAIDSEGDRPGCLAPDFLNRAQRARQDIPIGVALAHHMFENWFLAAAGSLAGHRGLRADLQNHPDPEAVHGAKNWLSDQMADRPYKPVTDQEPLARLFDIQSARRCPSFDKFWREVVRLCMEAQKDSSDLPGAPD